MCYQLFLLPRRARYVLLEYDTVFGLAGSCVPMFRKNVAPQNLALQTLNSKPSNQKYARLNDSLTSPKTGVRIFFAIKPQNVYNL